MRRLAALLLAAALAAALAACGSKKDVTTPTTTKPFTLMLDFFPNADHAAIYSALDHGDFSRVGLDVKPQAPSDPSAPLKLLAAGRVDMAISYEPEVLLARDKGLPVVAVGALVQRPLTSIIAIGSQHIKRVTDLAGKRVGTAGIPYQSAELKTVLADAHVPADGVTETNVGFDLVPAMLSKKVAATLGGFWNYEGIQLTQAHQSPTIIPVDQAGVPTYDELVLVVREDEAHNRGEDIRSFLHALTQGEQEVRADPRQAVDAIMKASPDLDRRLQLASVQQTLPATSPSDRRLPYGYMDPAAWSTFGQWMLSHQLITRPPNPVRALTDEFLPGQGVPGTGPAATSGGSGM